MAESGKQTKARTKQPENGVKKFHKNWKKGVCVREDDIQVVEFWCGQQQLVGQLGFRMTVGDFLEDLALCSSTS